MKIKLFDSSEVQDLYGIVVPHLDYEKSLTEREESIRDSKIKVKSNAPKKDQAKQRKKYNTSKKTKSEENNLEF